MGSILVFNALTAIGGGIGLIVDVANPPVSWLAGSPFHSYVFPGLVLLFIVGGSALVASLLLYARKPYAHHAAALSGALMMTWILVEILIIKHTSWLQLFYYLSGCAVVNLAYPGTKSSASQTEHHFSLRH